MKFVSVALGLAACAFALPAVSASEVVYGEVTRVTPKYRTEITSIPQQRCEFVDVPVSGGENGMGGTILGGIAGGVIGNQFGGGSGKTAMTAIGAVIGSQVGRNLSEQSPAEGGTYRREKRCHTTEVQERREVISGYTYEYSSKYGSGAGESAHPLEVGQSIRLRMSLRPEL